MSEPLIHFADGGACKPLGAKSEFWPSAQALVRCEVCNRTFDVTRSEDIGPRRVLPTKKPWE